jgi:pimeloyl-ACP methyl ester carboxylesterase
MKIIILPGLDGTGLLLAEFETILAQQHSVSVIQYPPELFRYEDLHRWIEKELPDDDFIFIAESFSGPLAIMLAAQKLPNLKGVIFVATFARSPISLPQIATHLVSVMPIKSAFLSFMIQPLVMGRWSNESFTRSFRNAMQIVPKATLTRRLSEVLTVDVREQLKSLSLPLLYLLATQDRLVPERMSRDFDLGPGTIFAVDAPHFLLQSRAEEAAKAVSAFLLRCEGGQER